MLGDDAIGFVEVESDPTEGGTRFRYAGWADVGNLHVAEPHRRQGICTCPPVGPHTKGSGSRHRYPGSRYPPIVR